MSDYKTPAVRPAPPEEPDWIDLSLPREVYRPLALLAAFWQVSRENAVGLLVRAVQFQEWPLGAVMTDPAAYQEWALRVTKAATGLKLPTVKDESLRFDSQAWWAGVEAERKAQEAAADVLFCVRCHHLREGLSLDREDGLCEECGEVTDESE